jgi:hypothetical protein
MGHAFKYSRFIILLGCDHRQFKFLSCDSETMQWDLRVESLVLCHHQRITRMSQTLLLA